MSTVRITILPVLLALAAAAPAAAQADDLVPAEQMVEDIPSISVSLRQIEQGLGQPSDFSRVYRAPGDQFMRIQGAVYAVYPTSEYGYNKKKKKTWAVIPAGTVFYIGSPPPPPETPAPRRPAADQEPLPITMRVVTTPADRRRLPSNEVVKVQIIADSDYRATRLHSLLSRAAKAAVTPPADDRHRRQRSQDSPAREPGPPSGG